MLEDLVAAGITSSTRESRLFNMARILDDLDDATSLQLLLQVSLSMEVPNWMKQYFDTLRYVCDHWEEYRQIKEYVSQLRWSHWLLSCQHTGEHLSDFWNAEGILGLDLFDLLSLAKPRRTMEERRSMETKRHVWHFGEESLFPVLDTLAPNSAQIVATAVTTQSRTHTAALVRQRITRLIFSSKEDQTLHPKAVLDMLDNDPRLFEATKLSLTILSETRGMKAELIAYILDRRRRAHSPPNWELIAFLLEESFADTKSVIKIFEEACVWSMRGDDEHYETCKQFLMPSAAVLCKYITDTDLCTALVEQWETKPAEPTDMLSVLEFVCGTYTLPFRDVIGNPDGGLVKSSDLPRSNPARVDLVKTCLLVAIRYIAPWVQSTIDPSCQETDSVRLISLL